MEFLIPIHPNVNPKNLYYENDIDACFMLKYI